MQSMLCKSPIEIENESGTHTVACGQCLHCRITRKQEIELRIHLEAEYYEQVLGRTSSFHTLTYHPDHIKYSPNGYQDLVKSDFQKFKKRLFKDGQLEQRQFGVGEYGEQSGRPHWHFILFGYAADYLLTLNGKIVTLAEYVQYHWSVFIQDEYGERSRQQIGHTKSDNYSPAHSTYISGYVVKKLNTLDRKRKNSDDDRNEECLFFSRNPPRS